MTYQVRRMRKLVNELDFYLKNMHDSALLDQYSNIVDL